MSVRTHVRSRRAARKRPAAVATPKCKRRVGPAGAAVEWRSQFERKLRERLDRELVPYGYETRTFSIDVPVSGYCADCGSKLLMRHSVYTPDFFFKTWTVEAKGKFTAKDRKRVEALLSANPRPMKFAMLFQRDNLLSKTSKTRYTDWCEKNGIACSVGWFDPEWLT